MAIKKGAFELYTAERQLPNKHTNKFLHKNHMFDEPQNSKNKNFIEPELQTIEHKNGSQSVHERFTTDNLIDHNSQPPLAETGFKNKTDKGSQSVHNRFTQESHKPIENKPFIKQNDRCTSQEIGSQSVHDRFTNGCEEIARSLDVSLQEDNHNASSIQTDNHKTIVFSKQVGNPREILLALYKNIKLNGGDATEELTLESVAELSNVNIKSLKNTLFRLSSMGLIIRVDQKVGRGGWVKYSLPTNIIEEIKATIKTRDKIRKK